jgi:hypothetical protein
VEDAERDLARMPFFVRPMARRGFASRTGLDHEAWRQRLAAVLAGDTPAAARARWADLDAALERLAEDFRTTPDRAAKGMSDQAVLRQVRERAEERGRAVAALQAWSRT